MKIDSTDGPIRRTDTQVEASLQYLTFSLRDEVFAMDIRCVREIVQYGAITTVPLMPVFVRGVVNVRGTVLPVIDLQARFGRNPSEIGSKTCVVIFDAVHDGEKVELGLMVDAVSEVLDIALSQIEPPPHFGTTITREFIHGMAKINGVFIVIVDLQHALDIADMVQRIELAQVH